MHRTVRQTMLLAAALFGTAAAYAADSAQFLVDRLPECFGAREPLQDIDTRPYVEVMIEGRPRLFLLDFGATRSTVDLARVRGMADDHPARNGAVTILGLTWFGESSTPLLRVQSMRHHHIGELLYGVIGTDILVQHVHTLDYRGQAVYQGREGAFCSDNILRKMGLMPLDMAGNYRIEGIETPFTPGNRWNLALVHIRVGGVPALGLLDSGYREAGGALIANELLLGKLRTAEVPLSPIPSDLQLTTCAAGPPLRAHQFRLPGGEHVTLGTDRVVRQSSLTPTLLALPSGAPTGCGNVPASWPFPAAVLGASFLKEAGLVVFDPFTARVWVHAGEAK